MSSWLACLAAKIDRGRKQTLLKRVVTALERLEVRIADASNPDTIPREPPVDLYDRVFNYRGKMDGLFWHLQHSYCVIMKEKDGTRRAEAQKAFKASVWPLYRNSPGADVARVVFQWLQALKNKLDGSHQDEENDDQKFLRRLVAAHSAHGKNRTVKQLDGRRERERGMRNARKNKKEEERIKRTMVAEDTERHVPVLSGADEPNHVEMQKILALQCQAPQVLASLRRLYHLATLRASTPGMLRARVELESRLEAEESEFCSWASCMFSNGIPVKSVQTLLDNDDTVTPQYREIFLRWVEVAVMRHSSQARAGATPSEHLTDVVPLGPSRKHQRCMGSNKGADKGAVSGAPSKDTASLSTSI